MKVGTTLKAPALAKPGNVYHVVRDGQTLICRTEERREGMVMVVTALDGSLQSQCKQG